MKKIIVFIDDSLNKGMGKIKIFFKKYFKKYVFFWNILILIHKSSIFLYKFIKEPVFTSGKIIGYFNGCPNEVRLDVCSICQLNCKNCSGQDNNMRNGVGVGYLKFKTFKKFINNNPKIKRIETSNNGEIFLNPDLKKIIKYAYLKKVYLTAYTGVNLNTVNEDMLESLVKYKFRAITIALDGASNKTYKIYRKGGNFNKVISNIKKINHYKKKYNSKYPILIWQFIPFSHNEKELPLVRKMAKDLGMGFKISLNALEGYAPIQDKEFVKREGNIDILTRDYNTLRKKNHLIRCLSLWTNPQINWDGRLFSCCIKSEMDFGNVFKDGLINCLKSERYKYTKKMLLGNAKPIEGIPCSNCRHYLSNISNNPIKRTEIFKGILDKIFI